MTNFSLVERVKGHGPALSQDELLDALAELDAWRAVGDSSKHSISASSPEELLIELIELENRPLCQDEDHADCDELESFFRHCEAIIGKTSAWQSVTENAKAMIEELHEMNRQLGGE